jgi:hypothetical protein
MVFLRGYELGLNPRMSFALAKHSGGSAKRSEQKGACSFLEQAEKRQALAWSATPAYFASGAPQNGGSSNLRLIPPK